MSIRQSRNPKGFIVEIRPPRWKETIWLGKFETLERARFVADAVRHYVGRPPSHYEEVFTKLPAIVCIGTVIGTPAVLSTREICASYVSAIAKGEAFEPQRVDFKQKVKKVVEHLDFSFLAHFWPKLDGLDNDYSNWLGLEELDIFPPSEPMAPTSKPEFSTDIGGISGSLSGTTSWRYKGVSHRMNEWVVEIRVPKGNKDNMGRNIWLGEYPTPLEAAFAFDVAVMCLGGGESRQLNFHHPIYEQIPRILPDLLPWVFTSECRKVVREFLELAKEAGNSVPMTLVGEPKNNTNSGGSPRGLQGTSRECPDLCPECSKTFLASQSMLHHLMDHWRNQKLSPPPQFSHDFGGDSWSPGMGSRWWSMYRSVRYWKLHDWEVDATRADNNEELLPQVCDKWAVWISLPESNEILLGLYSTSLEAAYAYDIAITCLGGKPLLNFHRHPIYTMIHQIDPNCIPRLAIVELKKVLKEFGKLVMEGGYYGKSIYTFTCPNLNTQV